jgi:acetolactate synthase-1/2/3 large subunit
VTASELAHSIAKALTNAGSRIVFGLPGGGHNLDLIGAAEEAGIRFVLGHLETTTAIMAATYADLTGLPTACVVTRGPGAASAVNGAAQALLDRQPLLLITDTVSALDGDRISHQRLDQCSMFAPVTKWSTRIGGPEADLIAARAVLTASTAPAGPVHLDFDPGWSGRVAPPPPAPVESPAEHLVSALQRLAGSHRPVLVLGTGARGLATEIRSIVKGTHVPVLMTYRAKGVVPDSWENSAGLFTGATIESSVLESADLIVAIGLDVVELIPGNWTYTAPVIALSSWPENSQYFTPEIEVVGNLAELVPQLAHGLNDGWEPGFGRMQRLHALASLRHEPVPTQGVAPADVVRQVRALASPGTIATVDAGAHMLAVMPLWEAEGPEEILISSGLATMGFAIPAAIAAALAYPDRRIVCFVGDGGLGMTLAELETIARLNLSITVVVFNDSMLSLIAVKQKPHGHGGSNAIRYADTDFALIATANGIPSRRAATTEELIAALSEAAEHGPFLIDVLVDPDSYRHLIRAIRGVPAAQ